MNEIVVGVMGAGSRGSGNVKRLCEADKRIRVKAVFDPGKKQMADLAKAIKQDVIPCSDYRQIAEDPEISWTMVMSPNCEHKSHAVASFKNGKSVFSEKPLATTIEDCQEIYDAFQASGKQFVTGFVLRYAPLYRKIRELLDSGRYGKLVSIDANENITPQHGSLIMRNWRRFTKFAGPHILEKCCHDIDLLNWFAGSLPSKVASFGGLDLFTPERIDVRDKYKVDGRSIFHGDRASTDVNCPFESEKDIVDNQVSIIEYRNRVRVQFQCTLSNAIPERRMYMSCTEGNIVGELYSGKVKARSIAKGEPELVFDCSEGSGHGGGDDTIIRALAATMAEGKTPECGGDEGLESSVSALAIDEARKKGSVVDLEPIWKRLGR